MTIIVVAELGMWGRSAGETGEFKNEIGIGDDAQRIGGSNAPKLGGVGVRLNFTVLTCYCWRDP